jgi:hypothetical protein
MGPMTLLPSEGRCAADLNRPCPGLNTRTLGPMVSTLTTRPSRTTFNKYYLDDQINVGEMSNACIMHGSNEKHIQNHGQKT